LTDSDVSGESQTWYPMPAPSAVRRSRSLKRSFVRIVDACANRRSLMNRSYASAAVQLFEVSRPVSSARFTMAVAVYRSRGVRAISSPSTRVLLTSELPPVASKPALAPPVQASGGGGVAMAVMSASAGPVPLVSIAISRGSASVVVTSSGDTLRNTPTSDHATCSAP
jgi:hypothetical protein